MARRCLVHKHSDCMSVLLTIVLVIFLRHKLVLPSILSSASRGAQTQSQVYALHLLVEQLDRHDRRTTTHSCCGTELTGRKHESSHQFGREMKSDPGISTNHSAASADTGTRQACKQHVSRRRRLTATHQHSILLNTTTASITGNLGNMKNTKW